MTLNRRSSLFALLLLLLVALPVHALIPGGGHPGKVDCYAEWVLNRQSFSPPSFRIKCADGDPTCDADGTADGKCTFNIGICVNETNVTGCTPKDVVSIKLTKPTSKAGIQPPSVPTTAETCGATTQVILPLKPIKRGKNKGKFSASKKLALGMTAKSSAKPSTDANKLQLQCVPGGPGFGPSCPACGPNPAGPDEPNEINVFVVDAGTDLDNGWRGASHNFPTPAQTAFQLCLQNCNKTTKSTCDTVANTGPGTCNGKFFGAPLPLVTASVPVCVENVYAQTTFTGGTADLKTGAISGPIKLGSAVYLTSVTQVCPSCESSKCDSGPAAGSKCTVDGVVTVKDPSAPTKTYHLSKQCPPPHDLPTGPPLNINLPLTTGTSTLSPLPGGSAAVPCVRQPGEPSGLTPQADLCGAGTCTGACSGAACAIQGVDYATGAPACVDTKGGISQFCCSNNTSLPCFPTGPGSIGQISRTGKATAPQPAWPDPTYPKKTTCAPGACTVQVATFCEAATGGSSVDGLTGLPGPGALILPVTTNWLTPTGR